MVVPGRLKPAVLQWRDPYRDLQRSPARAAPHRPRWTHLPRWPQRVPCHRSPLPDPVQRGAWDRLVGDPSRRRSRSRGRRRRSRENRLPSACATAPNPRSGPPRHRRHHRWRAAHRKEQRSHSPQRPGPPLSPPAPPHHLAIATSRCAHRGPGRDRRFASVLQRAAPWPCRGFGRRPRRRLHGSSHRSDLRVASPAPLSRPHRSGVRRCVRHPAPRNDPRRSRVRVPRRPPGLRGSRGCRRHHRGMPQRASVRFPADGRRHPGKHARNRPAARG